MRVTAMIEPLETTQRAAIQKLVDQLQQEHTDRITAMNLEFQQMRKRFRILISVQQRHIDLLELEGNRSIDNIRLAISSPNTASEIVETES